MPVASTIPIGPAPSQEQSVALVNQYIHTSFVDPYSVQDLTVEAPVQHGNDWIIYFSCNAKNRMGGYTGHERNVVMARNGAIDWPAQHSTDFWNQVAQGVANG
jgi:hypothetical protein